MNGRYLCMFAWLGNRTGYIASIPVVEHAVKHVAFYSMSHRFSNSIWKSTQTTSSITFIWLIHSVVSNVQAFYNTIIIQDCIFEAVLSVKKGFTCQFVVVSCHTVTVSNREYWKKLNFICTLYFKALKAVALPDNLVSPCRGGLEYFHRNPCES
jgi:hypothetical protein